MTEFKHSEDQVWNTIDPEHIWVMDKLILSRKLGYSCGPTGMDVPKPDWYIVRPCINAMGLGLGAEKVWLEKDTEHLPGYFWCEWFEGDYSIDSTGWGTIITVKGFNPETFTKWDKWIKENRKEHVYPYFVFHYFTV